jgi:YfiH family protein
MVGDSQEHVTENRRRSFEALGRDVHSLYDSWLVHGTDAIQVTEPRPLTAPHQKADIILTDHTEITLFMRYADCVPLIFYDPVRRVAGLAHAGWIGTVRRVGSVAVARMQEWYGCNPKDILAAIGPSICVEHYPVGPEVTDQVKNVFGKDAKSILVPGNGKDHFDLWKANQLILQQAGVRTVEISGNCTACHPEDWYSHRSEHGKTGRFGALLAIGSG